MLVFGTGRHLTDADRTDASVQSIYGIYDSAPTSRTQREAARAASAQGTASAAPVPSGRSTLVQQSIGAASAGSVEGQSLWSSTSNSVAYSTAAKKGWFIDLPAGERVISNAEWFEGKLVDVHSMVPVAAERPGEAGSEESCEPTQGLSYLTTINAIDGAAPKSQLYGAAESGLHASRIATGGKPFVRLRSLGKEHTITAGGDSAAERRRLGYVARRPSWHQLQ